VAAVPLLAFGEACIGVGLFISGVILLSVTTVLYHADMLNLMEIAILAFTGALLGDQVGYHTGRLLGPRIHHSRFKQRYSSQFERAEQMISKHAGGAVFIGRFIPAIRSLIPAMLGISQFPIRRYIMLDSCACALWALALAGLSWLSSQAF
jgi:membrane-associated protein